MTKIELIDEITTRMRVHHDRSVSKLDCENLVESMIFSVKKALRDGQNIELRGFGSFKVKEVAARMARNPKTGGSVKVAAHQKVSFKAGKDLV